MSDYAELPSTRRSTREDKPQQKNCGNLKTRKGKVLVHVMMAFIGMAWRNSPLILTSPLDEFQLSAPSYPQRKNLQNWKEGDLIQKSVWMFWGRRRLLSSFENRNHNRARIYVRCLITLQIKLPMLRQIPNNFINLIYTITDNTKASDSKNHHCVSDTVYCERT